MNVDHMENSHLAKLQEERFRSVVPHLFATPFYRKKLDTARIASDALTSLADLSRVPITTKEELRATPPLDRSPYGLNDLEFFFSSSGTSGDPTIYVWTREDTQAMQEGNRRAMERVGVSASDVAMVIAPMGVPIMWYCMIQGYNVMGAGVVPIGAPPPDQIADVLGQLPVSIIITLPVVGTRLFEYMTLQSAEPPRVSLRQFHVGGDFLSEARRGRIEAMWSGQCYNFYGLSEVFGPIAGECEQRRGLHLLSDYVYVEVLDPVSRDPVAPGEPGVAVYSTLWNKGSPLLRYWSDDYVSIDTKPCACGRTSPRLHYLGRPVDMAVVHGKRIFASQLEEAVLGFPVGNEYQLTIEDDSHAVLRVERLPGHGTPEQDMRRRLEELMECHVSIQLMDAGSLPRDVPKPHRFDDRR